MLVKNRTSILAAAFFFISINVIYFADLFGSNGEEILRTVKVKVTTVKESTSAIGKDVLENVKGWTLWDPLEWAEEEKVVVGDVAQDVNGIVHDPNEVVKGDEKVVEAGEEDQSVDTQPADGVGGDQASLELDDAVSLPSDALVLGQSDGNTADSDELVVSTPTSEAIPEATSEAKDDDDNATDKTQDDSQVGDNKDGSEAEDIASDEDDTPKKQKQKSKTKPADKTPVKVADEESTESSDTGTEEVEKQLPSRALTLPELCDETQWTPGLYLVCHSKCGANHTAICGGLNNARNRLQTCLRLAIDAGATLVLPQATTRKSSNNTQDGLRRVNFGSEPPDYFWDIKSLKRTLLRGNRKTKGKWETGVCKQLKIRDWNDWPVVEKERNLVVKYRPWLQQPYSKGLFKQQVDTTLQNQELDRSKISEKEPVLLNWGDPFLGWDYDLSNEMGPVRAGLFGALKFNKDMLALADSVLDSPQLTDGFIGIHLRGEKDWPAAFGSSRLQMKLYTKEIKKINLKKKGKDRVTTLYVSSGSQEPIQVFRDYVKTHLGDEYVVVDKWILLENRKKLLAKVEGLGFDRKAIVEYKTLVEGRYFLGIVTSTMSNLIAYARTVDQFVDSENDFFYDVVLKGSKRRKQVFRVWKGQPKMSGSATTKLLTLNARDIMQRFP